MAAEIAYQDPRWGELNFDIAKLVDDVISITFSYLGVSSKVASHPISISLSDDVHIAIVNKEYRGKDGPTNVLSFSYLDDVLEEVYELESLDNASPSDDIEQELYAIGDVIISYDTIAREAMQYALSFQERFTHMLIHSVLHIFGYDHQTPEEAELMEQIESLLMQKLGHDAPY